MSAVLPLGPAPKFPHPEPGFSREARARLETLRFQARRCRSAAHLDLFRACAMLSADRVEAGEAHVDAFFRCFKEGVGQAPRLYKPGSADLSFDETWLLRLLTVAQSGDDASFAFLIAARVRKDKRRAMAFLLRNIAAA